MAFIETIAESEATGAIAEMYDEVRASAGYVTNYIKVFSHRPDVFSAWAALNGSIKRGMDLRRYELATVAAARQLRSSYCSLVHGKALADRFLGVETVSELAADPTAAGLDPVDVAVMELATKVADGAADMTAEDLDPLRRLGLDDGAIFDVVLAAAARCFFSTVLDAVGTLPDAALAGLDIGMREALVVGRPIEDDGTDA